MIRTKRIDDWLRGVDEVLARRALLGLGIHRGELGAAGADAKLGIRLRRPVRWTLTDEEFEHRITAAPKDVAVGPDFELRLAVETDAAHDEIVRRLLGTPDVTSVFLAVRRPAGSLRRRAWRWPLRIGLLGYSRDAAENVRAAITHPSSLPRLLDIRRIEDEPGAVDVLIVNGPLVDAVLRIAQLRPVANLVVVLDEATESTPLVDALLATARAATSAVGSALAPPAELPELIQPLILHASHAAPLDVALTRAAGTGLLLYAEPDAMRRAALPEIALHKAEEFGRASVALPSLEPLRRRLVVAAEGGFHGEGHEATAIADTVEAAEPELARIEAPRWCQARVGADNVLRRGSNEVEFFIGPVEVGALAAPTPFHDEELPWEEDVDAFRLTVLFVPVKELLVAQEAELELPRFGRSPSLRFELNVEPGVVTATARIVVLFRSRVLQTAVLRGRVGRKARLTDLAAFVPDLDELDDRRPFDVSLFANDTAGQSVLLRSSRGVTRVSHGDDVKPIAGFIADLLAMAASRSSLKLDTKPARKLLIDLAVAGHDLYMTLKDELGSFAGKERIQVVSARSDFPLPIELVYEREPPDDDAELCPEYLADPERCTGACNGVDDPKVICPNAFWGMSKTIERQRVDSRARVDPDGGYLLRVADRPRAGRRDVMIDRIVVGASGRVETTDSGKLVKALAGAVAAKTWKDWTAALSTDDTQLLVLCPHADYKQFILEIGNANLKRGRIAARYVTGGREVQPFVLLFGCRTAPTPDDPAGFATRFMQTGARAVFHSSTDLLNRHAVELARRLASRLVDGIDPPQMLSEAMTAFRRQAVADGYLAGLSIAYIGDADWRV